MKTTKILTVIVAGLFLCCCASSNIKTLTGQEKWYDVIIIGAGGGGLGAAARLTRAGKSVLVIEQHNRVGGYMTNFERGDYRMEVSLHAMDGLDPNGLTYKLFNKLGIFDKIKPVRLDPMYRSIYEDLTIDVPADPEAYKTLLQEKFPHEARGIDDLLVTLDRIYVAMDAGMQVTQGETMSGLWGIVKHPVAAYTLLKHWDATAEELMTDFVQDEQLVAVFTQLAGFLGDGPRDISGLVFAVMWNSYHRDGYYYFEGGSQSVSDALAEVIRENGGKIKLNTMVTKILIEENTAVGVQTDDGQTYRSRSVISNANAPDTLFKLVGKEYLPKDYVTRVENMKIGIPCFMVYMGIDKDYSQYFPGTHEIFINVANGKNVNFNFDDKADIDVDQMPYAIANYSMPDPTAAPAGKNVITLTTVLPYDWKNGWYEDEDYDKYTELKNEVGMQLVKRAEEYLPGLSDHIEEFEVGSPRTMEHYTLNPKGSIIGWANTPEQSMLNRLEQETPIDNLFLAGAWTFPAGGQSAVIMSGLFAAELALDEMD